MDPAAIAAVFARMNREVWIVTAQAGLRRGGLTATFVSQASIVAELPRVLVGIARQHHTWELIEASGAFALHLLGATQTDWALRFGMQSGRDVDKLDGLACRTGSTGSPLLTEALGWLDCRVEARLDTGDRSLYLAEVVDGQLTAQAPVLTAQSLFQSVPPEALRQLRHQYEHDGAVDAAAIRAWRQQRGSVPSP